ncbi:hypothetical protein [Allorhizocola rhizosphaerae]|uniref:hypothetical protein n=1 Tax=Allorhizocola rhizosphaerae TaxID=1872709 RepID=UPI000E3D30B6|nr:hypothetical protein [Allorhizocola rhizosphaerae]
MAVWYEAHATANLYLSPLSIGEIQHGIERLRPRDPVRAAKLERLLLGIIAAYADRIAPFTAEAAREWGRMHLKQRCR